MFIMANIPANHQKILASRYDLQEKMIIYYLREDDYLFNLIMIYIILMVIKKLTFCVFDIDVNLPQKAPRIILVLLIL